MSAVYEIHLLHEGRDAVCSQLETALEAEVQALGLGPGQVSVHVNEAPPDNAEQDCVSRVAVFLASDDKPAADVVTCVDAWLAVGTVVVPQVDPEASFKLVVPKALQAINALLWDGVGECPRTLVVDILRFAGLAEEERAIFISYKRTDSRGVAEQLWEALSKRGFKVFLDQYSVDRGLDFQKELKWELREKSMVLLLESKNILDSKWVMEEVLYAMNHKLGLLSACWESVAGDKNRRVDQVPTGYRTILKSDELSGKGENAVLTDARLADLLDEVERVHAQAMARRRKELLNGFLRDLGKVPIDWLGLWRLSIRGKSTVYMEVTPRPIRPRDLYDCEEEWNRSDSSVQEGYVLHAGVDFSPNDQDYVEWIVNGNRVRALHGREVQELARRLQP